MRELDRGIKLIEQDQLDLQPTSIDVDDILGDLSPSQLKCPHQISRFGGPPLEDLRGFPNIRLVTGEGVQPLSPVLDTSEKDIPVGFNAQNEEDSPKTYKDTPYDSGFSQYLADHGILLSDDCMDSPPKATNHEEILKVLRKRRSSLSEEEFSEATFTAFRRDAKSSQSDRKFFTWVWPKIEGAVKDPYTFSQEILFDEYSPLTDKEIPAAKPDHYSGSRPGQIEIKVRKDLKDFIIPSSMTNLPAAPNFFFEAKEQEGSISVSVNQIKYDLALGARGQHRLRCYKEPNLTFDQKAYTTGSTYFNGLLTIFSCHPVPPTNGREEPGYIIEELMSYALLSSRANCAKGIAAYRNARDWAEQQRNQAIALANAKALGHEIMPQTNTSPDEQAEFFDYELSLDQAPSSSQSVSDDEPPSKRQRDS